MGKPESPPRLLTPDLPRAVRPREEEEGSAGTRKERSEPEGEIEIIKTSLVEGLGLTAPCAEGSRGRGEGDPRSAWASSCLPASPLGQAQGNGRAGIFLPD